MKMPTRWVRGVAVFLAIAYGMGAPIAAVVEYRSGFLSERFGYPPALIYATSLLQFGCDLAIVRPNSRGRLPHC